MSSNIFISTIMRDQSQNIPYYNNQIKKLVLHLKKLNMTTYLSIYENDSIDNTKNILKNSQWNFMEDRIEIISENLKTKKYGSVMDSQRVHNLAAARMKSIRVRNCEFLNKSDWVLVIEPDCVYKIGDIEKLILFKERYNLCNVDIVSGVTIKDLNNSQMKSRDTWATRKTSEVHPTKHDNLYDNWLLVNYQKYYSTFNAVCLYKSEVIRKGASFSGYNERYKMFDCDTAVICEQFHELNYSDIYIDHTIRNAHFKTGKVDEKILNLIKY